MENNPFGWDGMHIVNLKFLAYMGDDFSSSRYRDIGVFSFGGYYYHRALDFEYKIRWWGSDYTEALVSIIPLNNKAWTNIEKLPGYRNLLLNV